MTQRYPGKDPASARNPHGLKGDQTTRLSEVCSGREITGCWAKPKNTIDYVSHFACMTRPPTHFTRLTPEKQPSFCKMTRGFPFRADSKWPKEFDLCALQIILALTPKNERKGCRKRKGASPDRAPFCAQSIHKDFE